MTSTPFDQCIVLPFQPKGSHPFTGSGLALHFLLGNVLVLHSGLKEMWFGWRVEKIFPQKQRFEKYCRNAAIDLDLTRISGTQKIRFWIRGTFADDTAALSFFDARRRDNTHGPVDISISMEDGLVGFRLGFIKMLDATDCPMTPNQINAALWPERIGQAGLDAVGRALEAFYLFSAYGAKGSLAIFPFEKACDVAPESFMAHDLHGWACYRNRRYREAKTAFLTSLCINPAGAGAMSGLMWCGVYGKNLEEAMYWAGRKAEACRQDVQAAREIGRRRYEKINSTKKQ